MPSSSNTDDELETKNATLGVGIDEHESDGD
jgi:hypothetical protein